MDTARQTPRVTTEQALIFAAAASGLVFLRSQGTGDVVNLWLTFLRNMEQHGVAGGFRLNAADQPPLAPVFLLCVRTVCNRMGAVDFTSLKVGLLLFYGWSIAVFRAYWRGFAPLALFVGTILLSSMLRSGPDVLYAPTFLLALWALRQQRIAVFSALYAVSCLINWQPLIIAPFLLWQALRPPAPGGRVEEAPAGRRLIQLLWPGGLVFLAAGLTFGWPLFQAWRAALASPYLSSTALNANWVWTFLLHCRNPAVFGPLVNGYPVSAAYPIAFSPVVNGYVNPVLAAPLGGWVWLPRGFFAVVYATVLWRFVRGGRSFADLLRAALLGALADCLFDTGVRENQFFASAVLACVLASADPRETARAVVVTAMAALNLVIFDGFLGNGLGYPRIMGIDLTVPLALLYVAVFLWWWVSWLLGRPRASQPFEADLPLAPGGPRANVSDLAQPV